MTVPWGPIINAVTVCIGATLGLFLGSFISDRIQTLVFQLFGLCLVAIGLDMVSSSKAQVILVVISCVLGAVTGELLRLQARLDSLGDRLKAKLKSRNPNFTEGLVTSSVLVCAGAMSIMGSFEEGLGHGKTTVLTKTVIDFFAVMILSSRLGAGVIFSAACILVYQGGLTMLATFLQPFMRYGIESTLTATGGILVMGIAVNMIGLRPPVSISNSLPALAWAVILGAMFA
ncbi:MAG: DUF554 domain-containing protein [Deltaproteobacteria bacterium]|jgi:uncharacterized membrane protein YqgA involved in biofilm formation|nr:DUF554 domain-containing protein [Deltaproteobacteria bacterium]